jgi:hypothetical protein
MKNRAVTGWHGEHEAGGWEVSMTQEADGGSMRVSALGPTVRDVTLALHIVAPTSEMSALKSEISASGGTFVGVEAFVPKPDEREDYLESKFDPLSVAVCVVALTWAAERIMRMIKTARHSGLIVDMVGEEVEVREHPALPVGSALVRTQQGAQFFDTGIKITDVASLLAKAKGG